MAKVKVGGVKRLVSRRVTRVPLSLPTHVPQKASDAQAPARERSTKLDGDNKSEDENRVDGMLLDTEQEPSLSHDSGEQMTGPGDVESKSDDGDSNSNNETPVLDNGDSSQSRTEKPGSEVTGAPSSSPLKGRQSGSSKNRPSKTPKLPLPSEEPAAKTRRSGTDSKRASTSSRSRTSGPTPISPILVTIEKAKPLSKATRSVPSPFKGQNPVVSLPGPALPNDTPVPHASSSSVDPSSPRGPTGTPGKVVQGGPLDPLDVPRSNPDHDGMATAEVHSTSQVAEPELAELEPNQGDAHTESGDSTEGPPARSPAAPPYKSDIESLYASSSPEKGPAEMEIEPIELDSDPDFEKMEQMLFSHRGPSSQSQSIRKESIIQPPALRSLKRQRSHPSPFRSSQAATQEPRADSQPSKRPRINGSHPSDLVVPMNDRKKHPEFWDLDGTVVLQVDDILFRVMRSTLSKASPWFQRLFSEEFDHLEVMAGCPVYLVEEDLSHLDFANLLRGLENGLEYALSPPHYLRILSIFRAASLLEFDTLRRWSLGCLERQWPADLPPPSKPSKFGIMIPWPEETLAIANLLDVPQVVKRAYWEMCTRPEFGRIDAEVYDEEVEEIMPTRPRLPRSVMMNLTRLRERLFPEWTRITRSPPVDVSCARAAEVPSTPTTRPSACSLDYASWYKVISAVEINDMTIDDRRMDPISALEVMIVEVDWEKEGGFCADCVKAWKTIWTKDREKIWKNLGDWLELDVD